MDDQTLSIVEAMKLALDHHRAGRLRQAEQLYRRVLDAEPEHPEANHGLGMLAHGAGNHEAATRLMTRAIESDGGQPSYLVNLGLTLHAQGKLGEALAAYDRALRIDPSLAGAHYNRGVVLQAQGRLEEAAAAYERAARLQPGLVQARYNRALVLQAQGRLEPALDEYGRVLATHPGLAEAHNNRGNVLQSLGRLEKAEAAFRQALSIRPDFAGAHHNLGNTLKEQGKLEGALTAYERAVALDPDLAEAHNNRGMMLQELDRHEEALGAYQHALRINPGDAQTQCNIAALYERKNRLEESATLVREALRLDPSHLHANYLAAVIARRQGDSEGALRRLRGLHLPALGATVSSIHFELGTLHDLRGEPDEAFRHFTEGNRAQARSPAARKTGKHAFLERIAAMRNIFTEGWVASWSRPPPERSGGAPVFLVGFLRSGTTLIDQVLDGHSRVVVVEEKPALHEVVRDLSVRPEGYPLALAHLTEDERIRLRSKYRAAIAQPIDRDDSSMVVDKFPLNLIHAGLIARLFPDARVILALRHPLDVCLSCFMQPFRMSNDMAASLFTLEDTAELYHQVMGLWETYRQLLPLNVHVLRYESLVEDFEREVRALFCFLRLDWEPAVLEHCTHARTRSWIKTPSYAQVTEPLYQRARFRWQQYRKHLAPIQEKLAPHVSAFGYEMD